MKQDNVKQAEEQSTNAATKPSTVLKDHPLFNGDEVAQSNLVTR
jgi:hypothetical protein